MKKIHLLFLLFTTIYFGFGQNTNPLDEKYQPPKKSFFGLNAPSVNKSESFEDKSNVFSLVVTEFARLNVRLEYERKIFNNFSFLVSGGIAFGSDFAEKSYNHDMFFESDIHSPDEIGLSQLYRNSNFDFGYNYSFSLKYYFMLKETSSLFYEIGWKKNTTSYTIFKTFGYDPNSLKYNVSINYWELMVGKKFTFHIGKVEFAHSISSGIGVKQTTRDKYNLLSPFLIIKANETCSTRSIGLLIKYKIGFGW